MRGRTRAASGCPSARSSVVERGRSRARMHAPAARGRARRRQAGRPSPARGWLRGAAAGPGRRRLGRRCRAAATGPARGRCCCPDPPSRRGRRGARDCEPRGSPRLDRLGRAREGRSEECMHCITSYFARPRNFLGSSGTPPPFNSISGSHSYTVCVRLCVRCNAWFAIVCARGSCVRSCVISAASGGGGAATYDRPRERRRRRCSSSGTLGLGSGGTLGLGSARAWPASAAASWAPRARLRSAGVASTRAGIAEGSAPARIPGRPEPAPSAEGAAAGGRSRVAGAAGACCHGAAAAGPYCGPT